MAVVGLFAACESTSERDAPAVTAQNPPNAECGDSGMLQTRIYGAIQTRIEWQAEDLQCSGMPRPEGRGARLRLAGIAGEHALAIIVAIPGFDRDAAGNEFDANVTLIAEGDGRFFSTADLDNCLAEIASVQPIDDSGERFAVSGALYCAKPLPEINGAASVSIPELHFSGLMDWSAS